jgi:hypothetical protein
MSLGPNPMYSRFLSRVVLALRSFGILGEMVGVMCNICNHHASLLIGRQTSSGGSGRGIVAGCCWSSLMLVVATNLRSSLARRLLRIVA